MRREGERQGERLREEFGFAGSRTVNSWDNRKTAPQHL